VAVFACVIAQEIAGAAWAVDRDRSLGQLHHSSWTMREGAPMDVEAIAQTEDGFMWFGTGTGLVRFDGAQFERFVSASGDVLPSGAGPIRSLYALPGNALIIGWAFGGATVLRDGRVTNYGPKEGFPTGSPYQFLTGSDDLLWVATADALARFDGKRWHVIGADWNFAGQRAVSLFLDRDGTMAAFTPSTLMILPKGATAFQPTGGKSTSRVPIVRSRDGTLFFSDNRGIRSIASLARYDEADRPLLVGAVSFTARRMIVDRDGNLWFQDERGLGRIAHPERPGAVAEYFSRNEGLTDEKASRFFEDRQGNVWVTTASGIDRFRTGPFVAPTGILRANFAALAPYLNGGLLVASHANAGQHLAIDGTAREFGLKFVTCAYRDPDGAVWFGSQRDTPRVAEFWKYQNGRIERVDLPADIPPNAVVQAVTMGAGRSLWVSIVRAGNFRLSGGSWSRVAELPDAGKQTAVVMTSDSRGRVWLGYPGGGVSVWDEGKVRTYLAADGLEVGNVLAIQEKGSHLWVAGERGLAIFESERFRMLSAEDPDVFRGIRGLVETDEGDLWLHGATGAILVKADQVRGALRQPSHAMSVRLFAYDDGFIGVPTDLRPLPSLVASTDGRLWFATNRGVYMHDPRRSGANETAPTVVVTGVVAGGARYLSAREIELPALATSLQVDYTATSMAVPGRTRFRHKLDGVDRDWQDAGARRQAFYTNLGPGTYRLQVIAANEDGVWSTTGATVDWTIAPAWYQTGWFKALCVLAALVFVGFLFNLRIRQMRTQIQARLQERLLERERIARELHDTMIQGFQGLVLTFAATIRRIAPGEPREALEKALDRAQETLALGRDRVRDLRDSVGFSGDLAAALKDAADDLAVAHPAAFELSERGVRRDLHPVGAEEVYLIAREALANAYRHAAARRIEAEIEYGASHLRVRVRDDGKGVPREVIERGVPGHWGMTGMRERAQKLGARLLVRSGDGSGTEVELDVPAEVGYVH